MEKMSVKGKNEGTLKKKKPFPRGQKDKAQIIYTSMLLPTPSNVAFMSQTENL